MYKAEEYEKVILLKYLVMIREVGRSEYINVRATLDGSDRNLSHSNLNKMGNWLAFVSEKSKKANLASGTMR